MPAAYGCGGKTATVPKLANPASAKVTMATVYSENSLTRRPKVESGPALPLVCFRIRLAPEEGAPRHI